MNTERVNLLKEFIKKEPEDPFNKYALAMEYYDMEPIESLKILQSLLDNHPDYLPTYFKTAHLLWEEEKWDDADLVFQNGIKLAQKLGDQKALGELKAAYQNFEFDRE